MMRLPETSCSLGLAAALALALAGCEAPMAPAPQYPQAGYPPGQPAPQGYPVGQLAPQGGYPAGQLAPQSYGPAPYGAPGAAPPGGPQGYPPQAYPPAPQAYPPPQQAYPPPAFAANDPINTVDLNVLRATARGVLGELVAALPPAEQVKVQGIPLVTDAKVGEVNAYAACDGSHMPHMAITDGLLQTEAYIAQLRATDEVYGTQKLGDYLNLLRVTAQDQKPGQPIMAPPAGSIDPVQHVDPRKVARQHQLFEEQVAFVLGHELGHHWLGHTGCANGRSGDHDPTLGDLIGVAGRITNQVVPFTNQPNEVAADGVGIDDVLAAGARRPGYHWTEQGALLTIGFFAALDQLTPMVAITTWVSSHPNPALRADPIRREAAHFRATGVWYQPLLALP
jgi:Peptidase family M48